MPALKHSILRVPLALPTNLHSGTLRGSQLLCLHNCQSLTMGPSQISLVCLTQMMQHWSMLQGVLMVGLSSSQPQSYRKHIIFNLLHCKPMLHSKRCIAANGKSVGLQRWTSCRWCVIYDVSPINSEYAHGGNRRGCLVAVKYESLVLLPIYAPHELKAIIPTSMSHTVM